MCCACSSSASISWRCTRSRPWWRARRGRSCSLYHASRFTRRTSAASLYHCSPSVHCPRFKAGTLSRDGTRCRDGTWRIWGRDDSSTFLARAQALIRLQAQGMGAGMVMVMGVGMEMGHLPIKWRIKCLLHLKRLPYQIQIIRVLQPVKMELQLRPQ